MGLLDQFLPDDEGFRGNLGSGISALGLALASSPSNAPFANLPQAMAIADRSQRTGTSRAALKALLMQAGYSASEAEQLSATEGVAKLAIDQKREQGFNTLVGSAFGGGGAGGSVGAPATPSMTPPAPAGPAAGVSLNGSKADKAKAVYEGLIQRGLPPVAAAGMVGNIDVESGGFNPGAVGDSGTAFGYHQARGERFDNLQSIAKSRGVGWQDHDAQLDNIVAEFGGKDAGMARALAQIKANPNTTPEQAAELIARLGERPSTKALAESLPRRTGTAAQVYGRFAGQGAPQQVASASGAVPSAPGVAPQVAESENDVRRLELQMGMRPTPQAAQALQTAQADMPAEGTSPVEYRIPGGQTGAPDNATRVAARTRMQAEVNNTLALIARTGMYGDRGKALAEALKEKIKPLQKYLEPTDIERTLNAADAADPESARILRNSIQDSRPSTVQEYEYGRQDPDFIQYQKQMKEAGRSQVNIDSRTEGEFEKEFGKDAAKRFGTYITVADQAKAKMSDIATLREVSNRLGSLGKSADARLALGPYAEAAGIKIDGLDDLQVFQSVTARLAPQLREPGSGNMSDADLKGFQRAIGSASNSPEARERILDVFEAAARNQMTAGGIARDLASKKITREEAETRLQNLPSPMEAFRAYQREQGRAGAAEQSQQPAQPPAGPMTATERAVSIRNAKEAVRRNPAIREQVLQRLRDAGIDVGGF